MPLESDLDLLSSISNDVTDDEILSIIELVKREYPADPTAAAALARALAGSEMFLPSDNEFSADVASTGGPSSLSTLLSPLFLREGGAIVPKLGVPGRPAGGIDCLAQIGGYEVLLDRRKVDAILNSGGYAHFVADGQLAPLDGRVFRMRQQSGHQSVPTLVAASLLSKKLAVGIRRAGLDVRVAPHGNFGVSWDAARANAALFVKTAQILSIEAFPVLTDARYPYQPFIGRSEALVGMDDVFRSQRSPWLEDHYRICMNLALACAPPSARAAIADASPSDLRRHFDQNLLDQGASPEAFEQLVESTRRNHIHQLRATSDGFIHFPLEAIRRALVVWQKAEESAARPFPDPVGLILCRRPGERVRKGDVIATVRVTNGQEADVLRKLGGCGYELLPYPLGPNVEGTAK